MVLIRTSALCLFLTLAAPAGLRVFLPVSFFDYEKHPDLPFSDYGAGDLGVILPSYARSYLYVAYRYLEGTPFTEEERARMKDVWNFRIHGDREAPRRALKAWIDLRRSMPVAGADPVAGLLESPWRRRSFQTRGMLYARTCTADAFVQAAARLSELSERFGRESAAVRSWIVAQDLVFHQCLEPKRLPALEDGLPAAIRFDREYQRAAALFHGGNFEGAEKAFRAIRRHPESPWTDWAPYMAGRSMLWHARILPDEDPEYLPLLRRTQRQLERVLLDEEAVVTHDAARYLLFRVLTFTDPEAAARMLGLRLMSELRVGTRFHDLDRYLTVLDNANPRRWWSDPAPPFADRIALGRRDRLTAWITAFQATEPEAVTYTVERWREIRSTAWLIAALSKVDPEHEAVPELLEAARADDSRFGAASIAYYAARLLARSGRYSEAREWIDRALPLLARLPSSRNRMLALRAEASRGYGEMLEHGVQLPVSIGMKHGGEPARHAWRKWVKAEQPNHPIGIRLGLMPRVAHILNSSAPLERLVELSRESTAAAESVRRDVAVALWVRAVLLERWDVAQDLTRDVGMLAPQTQSSMEEFAAASDQELPFLSKLILLRFPGMSPKVEAGIGRVIELEENHYSGYNWWWWPSDGESSPVRPESVSLEWVSAAGRERAHEEWDQILGLARSGAGWLFASVYEACKVPSAPRGCPEALYRATYNYDLLATYHWAMQYPGRDWDSHEQSPRRLLAERYPRSRWLRLFKEYESRDGHLNGAEGFGRRYRSDPDPPERRSGVD